MYSIEHIILNQNKYFHSLLNREYEALHYKEKKFQDVKYPWQQFRGFNHFMVREEGLEAEPLSYELNDLWIACSQQERMLCFVQKMRFSRLTFV